MITFKVLGRFESFCKKYNYKGFNESVKSYNNTTLFCPAGMQKYTEVFYENKKPEQDIITNCQSVLRTNDINEITDNSHYLYFNMLGYFDFRKNNIEARFAKCYYFWSDFLTTLEIDTNISYAKKKVIHPHILNIPDISEIKDYDYLKHLQDNTDENLIWTDGKIKGYSLEFYINDIEVGNIVLYENGMIDCGFGLERLEMFYNKDYKKPSECDILIISAIKIIDCGYFPKSNGTHSYILWDIFKRLLKYKNTTSLNAILNSNKQFNDSFIYVEKKYNENQLKYEKLKNKYKDKDKQWWKETHGIDL